MRRAIDTRTGLASVALVTMLGALLLLARPAGAQSEIIVYSGQGGRHVFQDVGDDGLRLGDRLTGRFPLTDATGASTIGTGHQSCVVQRRITDGPEGPGGVYRCSYLLRLADGDLIIEGLDPHGPGVYTMAVLGGTGSFADATGEATLTDSSVTEFVINLTY
jgi:hypothetical protein